MKEETSKQAKTAKQIGARSPQLMQLSPEEVRALSPEDKTEWRRQCRDEEADYEVLTQFIDALYPLSRRHYKACRDNDLSDGLDTHGAQEAWEALTDHLLSLPKFSKNDPGWLARVKQQTKRIKALYRAGIKRRKSEEKVMGGRR